MSVKQEYKQTELGEIPEKWKIEKLENIIIELKSGFASGKRDENGIIQLRMNNISTDGRVVLNSYLKVPRPKNISDYLLKNGDILFNNTNSVDLIGKTAIFREEVIPCTYSNHLTRLRVDLDQAIPEYVLYHIIRRWEHRYFYSICNRHVGQAGIKASDIKRIKLAIASLDEQHKIASVLSTVDEAIQKTAEVIGKAEMLKRGLMQRLLTRGIGHTRFKQTEIGEIPEEWEVVRLEDVCTSGTGGTPSRQRPEYFQGEIPWVKSTEIDFGVISHTEESISSKALTESSAKLYPKGSLLLALYGQGVTRGKCALLGIDAAINQACGAFESKGKIQSHFAFFWLQANYRKIRALSQGSNQANLNLGMVRSIKLPLPPLTEQRKITSILSAVDEKLQMEKQRKEQLEKLKKGLMEDLLTGKVRVKVD